MLYHNVNIVSMFVQPAEKGYDISEKFQDTFWYKKSDV